MESGYTAARAAFCGPRCFRSPSPFKGRPVVSYPDMWPGPIRKPRLPGVSVFNKPQWIFYGPARPGSGKRLSREARERAVRVGERKIPGFRRSRALVLSCPVGTKHRNAWRVFVVVDRFFNMNEQRHFVCVCVRLCVYGVILCIGLIGTVTSIVNGTESARSARPRLQGDCIVRF